MHNFPLVSIITPSFNSERYIAETITSVLKQTYQNWEMLIVDDLSIDNSASIIKSYMQKDKRIKLISLPENVGAAQARNIAIKEAEGRYIAFLDSDDTWMPQKLEKQIDFLKQYNLVLTYSSYETMDANSNYINTRKAPQQIAYTDMLKSNHIGNLTGIYDANYFGKVYLTEQGHEDYILWLTLLKKIGYTKGIEEPLARYRVHRTSLSSNKIKVLQWQWHIYRNIVELNLFQSSYYMLWYIFYALNKRR